VTDETAVGPPAEYAPHLEQLRSDLDLLGRRIREVAETAYSIDRTVAATVGGRGELRELVLDPRIYRTTNAAALAATIRDTITRAADAASATLFDLIRPVLPDDLQVNSLKDIEVQDLFDLPRGR
jgi:hypothetical protein